jgi:N-terminal domain of anti-restriction factor ArdC
MRGRRTAKTPAGRTARNRRTPAEHAATLKAATARRDTQVAEMIASDAWQAFLRVQARFHRYSFNNVCLILAQRPTATMVMGYRAWQGIGRQVRRDEKAIRIFGRSVSRVPTDPEQADAASEIDANSGQPEAQVRVRWPLVRVFDIAQTDGDPLPAVPSTPELTGDTPMLRGLYDAFAAEMTARGFTVVLGTPAGGAGGVTDYAAGTVTIDVAASTAKRAHVAGHELGHIACGHGPDDCRPDRPQREVEAESVAYVVQLALGVDTGLAAFPYMTAWSGGDAALVRATGDKVQQVAEEVLDAIEARPGMLRPPAHPAAADPVAG